MIRNETAAAAATSASGVTVARLRGAYGLLLGATQGEFDDLVDSDRAGLR